MKVPPQICIKAVRGAVASFWAAGVLLAQEPPPAASPTPPPATEELSVAAELSIKAPQTASGSAAPGDIPRPFPISRYAALLEKSPFAVATAVPEAAPPAENFSTNFVVTGIGKNRGSDGKEVYTVFVRSRDLATRLVLTGDKPSDEGISVAAVEEAAVAAKSVVILKKGSETGRVEFDQAALAATGGGQLPPSAPQPGRPGIPTSRAPTSSAARPAIPRPGMTSVPRPGASLTPPQAPTTTAPGAGVAPAGQELRRRVRPIQGAPGSAPEPP
jgi:hypothetical protein